MTLAEATSLVVMPGIFLVWGIAWGLPRDLLQDPPASGWTQPRVFLGLVGLVVAMNLGIVDVFGSLVVRAVVLVVAPFVGGLVLGRRIGAHERGRSADAP